MGKLYEFDAEIQKIDGMGRNCHFLGLTKEVRKAIGKGPGDRVHVVLVKDDEPRAVTVPDDLQCLLDVNDRAASFYEALSYSHKREYVQWIEEAKRPETRQNRLTKAIEMLSEGRKR